jgi:PPOX class probable F420-dependent enzyme
MAAKIPDNFIDLLNKATFAHLATTMADGRPQVTPVWIDFDGSLVLVNSGTGRVKDKNMRRDNRVALSILDPDNPYRYLSILGEVVEVTETGANEHIDRLAKKYLGKDKYPYHRPGESRVIYKIRPDKVSTHG